MLDSSRPRTGGRRERRYGGVLIVLVLLGVVVTVYETAADEALKWRGSILFDKATGRIQDIGWFDLFSMLRPGSGFYLARLAETRNPYTAIDTPYRTKADIEAGASLFRERCASCHGDQARGGTGGPSLHDRQFRQGRSDWALYRTIQGGIPGTAMAGWSMPGADAWRLVSYLDNIMSGKAASAAGAASASGSFTPVSAAELREAADDATQWLMYSGTYSSTRHSGLAQIHTKNVPQLKMQWQRQMPGADPLEASPVVRGSTMFVSVSPGRVVALDAATGRVIWTFTRDLPAHLSLCCGTNNRGVAVLGNRVFVGTLDAHLIALDAATGELLWDVAVADSNTSYSITGAPLAVGDMIVTGIAGGEFPTRGFLDAYDAATGARRWRFYTVPEPGAPGSETWQSESARSGGGPTWLTGSYDPDTGLLYWGVGNPSPNFYGGDRGGDNLYTNCLIAVEAATGKLRWYFQFTPHDLHDWDAVQIPVLFDAVMGGTKRKLLAFANRNAFYYVLDRTNGEYLLGVPYERQNWADGLDVRGRPKVRPESVPSREGALVYPGVAGATNWRSPAYNPDLQTLYVSVLNRGTIFFAAPNQLVEGQRLGGAYQYVPDEPAVASVKALDAITGRVRWQYTSPPQSFGRMGGLMSTAGGLVFGAIAETFFALDAATGTKLWEFPAGALIVASPVSYEIAGHQYVAVAAGRSILAFALPSPSGGGPPAPSRSATPLSR